MNISGTCGAALFAAAFAARADTINTLDRGWHENGSHYEADNTSYYTGRSSYDLFRSYFYFHLPTAPPGMQIVSARFRTFTFNVTVEQTVTLYDYLGPIQDLLDANTGLEAFDDLGSGAVFGQFTFAGTEDYTFIEYELTPAGIAALNAALGGELVFGARSTAEDNTDEYISFAAAYDRSGGTPPDDGNTQLQFEFGPIVPMPGAATMGLTGLGLLALARARSLLR